MNARETDLKVTDTLERQLIEQEFAEISLGGIRQIDTVILRLLAVTSLLAVALMLAGTFL